LSKHFTSISTPPTLACSTVGNLHVVAASEASADRASEDVGAGGARVGISRRPDDPGRNDVEDGRPI